MKQELLAPAGDIESAYAGLFYGADALYLGLRQFSARATATNFSPEELFQITGYAHSLKRKIYTTINTLLQNTELENLTQILDVCLNAKVDGVIVQDLGVAHIIQESYPELELHASTQMAVHNKEGALFLKKLGFKRVVLARELTLQEINEIASIPDLETEAFIHGALCYSYSGLCQFSSLETGMSANRGKCLYPCRACFGGDLGDKHLFSMKDMALETDVLKMPTTSLKIEGRKKSALYVACVVNYYRKLLDNQPVNRLADDIKQVFARPWTKLHFLGKNKQTIDTEFVGHRGLQIGNVQNVVKGLLTFKTQTSIARFDGIQIDVKGQEKPFGFSLEKLRVQGKNVFQANAGETVEITLPPKSPFIEKNTPIYLASSSRVKGAYHYSKPKENLYQFRMPIDVHVVLDEKNITASCQSYQAKIVDSFEKANDFVKVKEAVIKTFSKTGDTQFQLNNLTFENDLGLFVPASTLNDLRRKLYAQIPLVYQKRSLPNLPPALSLPSLPKWIIKTDDIHTLCLIDLNQFAEIIVALTPDTPVENLLALPKNKVRLALPTVARKPALFHKVVDLALNLGYKKWEVGNCWGIEFLPNFGIDLSFDNTLYMMNTQACAMASKMGAKRITLSIEDTQNNLQIQARQSTLPTVLVVYQDVPLFISANCIRPHSCKECLKQKQTYSLTKNNQQYTAISAFCQTIVIAQKAFCLGQKAFSIPSSFYRIDFVNRTYTPQQAKQITETLLNKKDVPNTTYANWEHLI